MTTRVYDAREFDDGETYVVLINREKLYALWASEKQIPAGWRRVSRAGSRSQCLDYIREAWGEKVRPALKYACYSTRIH